MALKITKDGEILYKRTENGKKFNKSLIAKEINTNLNNIKIINVEYYIIAINKLDKNKNNKFNPIASIIMNYEIYGDILVIPGQELDDDILKKYPSIILNYEPKIIETKFIFTLKETLKVFEKVANYYNINMSFEYNNNNINANFNDLSKEIIYFNPDKINLNKIYNNKEIKDFIDEIFNSILLSLKTYFFNKRKNKNKNTDLILFEDNESIIKFTPEKEKITKTLNILMQYFIKKEEYEKCSDIKNIHDKYIKTLN